MARAAAYHLSKRLQTLVAALFCLTATQLVLASCTPEPVLMPTGARIAIAR
jgi:hypothetical protein